MTPPKEHSKLLVTDPKELEVYELPDKEFKIIFQEMLRELQENRNKQFNDIRKNNTRSK